MRSCRASLAGRTGLYAITDADASPEVRRAAVEAVAAAGATLVQYRVARPDVEEVRALVACCALHDVPLIVNDDPALARAGGAAGVHLGREDPPLREARAVLGAGAIIGVSCYDRIGRALVAAADGADYVAFGSFAASSTKPDAVRAAPELLTAARTLLRLPLVAIGGIDAELAPRLLAAGATLLAASAAVFRNGEPARATDALLRAMAGASAAARASPTLAASSLGEAPP